MASYRIEWKRSALKELRKIDSKFIKPIINQIEQLPENPYPSNCKKLVGSEHTYRIRINDYRVIYEVIEERIVIYITRVRHRKDAYKK